MNSTAVETVQAESAPYRIEKELSQSTVISSPSPEETSTQTSSKALKYEISAKKGWSAASVKQSIGNPRVLQRPDSMNRKPAHSYSSLITEAIRLNPKGQMTLNEIYLWLIDRFPYFKSAGTGWKVRRQLNPF